MLLWNWGSFSLKQALRSNYLFFPELRSLKQREIVTYSQLSSPDKIFTLFIRIASKFHFSCLLLFLGKHVDFFFSIPCTYKVIIHEDPAVCFAFPNLAQPNLFPRGLHVRCCFPVCLGITASPLAPTSAQFYHHYLNSAAPSVYASQLPSSAWLSLPLYQPSICS